MTFSSMLGNIVAIKYQRLMASGQKPTHTPAPLGLHQGTSVEFALAPFILAANKAMPDIDMRQTVVSVGQMAPPGIRVTRSYLSDGRSFIQVVSGPAGDDKIREIRVYTLYDEKIPADANQIAEVIGKQEPPRTVWNSGFATGQPQQQSEMGPFTPGLIGWPAFQLDTEDMGSLIYLRARYSKEPLAPDEMDETVVDASGQSHRVHHWMMSYSRLLGVAGQTGQPFEFLQAELCETEEGMPYDVFVGLAIDQSQMTVYPS